MKKDYRIITDSSCELPQHLIDDDRFVLAPFRVEVDGVPIRDSRDINTKSLLEKVVNSKTFAALSCPSPDVFYSLISQSKVKRIYIITMSSKISGCYMSALIAKKLYEDAHDDRDIYVIDSKSVSGGESLLALLAMELEEQGVSGEEIKKRLVQKRDQLRTVVLLDNITALYKNIKFPKLKEVISKASNIRYYYLSDKSNVEKISKEKVTKDSNLKDNLSVLVDNIAGALKDASNQTRIIITHCNNRIGAERLRDMLIQKLGQMDFIILSTSGPSSMLACEGGIFVTY